MLVGYRAAGKTSAGRAAAERLGVPFVDSDAVIEQRHGRIAEIFRLLGESAFRDREAQIIAELLQDGSPRVLATGGGCVLRVETRARLRDAGVRVIYLHAPAEALQRRLRADAGDRPSLSGGSVADEVPAILAAREPLYRAVADVVIAADRPREAVVADLIGIANEG